MDKRFAASLLIILFTLSTAFAQEEFVIEEGILDKQDLILKQAQETVLQTSSISTKIDDMAATNVSNLEIITNLIVQNQNQNQTNLIVLFILVTLASQGLWWAIFLYLQTKGLLHPIKIMQKPKKGKKNA